MEVCPRVAARGQRPPGEAGLGPTASGPTPHPPALGLAPGGQGHTRRLRGTSEVGRPRSPLRFQTRAQAPAALPPSLCFKVTFDSGFCARNARAL